MIKWQGEYYDRINEFDGIVVSLVTKGGGRYFTTIPISPKEYRATRPTKAGIKIKANKRQTYFYITDDWGSERVLRISNGMKKEIAESIEKIKTNGLLRAF